LHIQLPYGKEKVKSKKAKVTRHYSLLHYSLYNQLPLAASKKVKVKSKKAKGKSLIGLTRHYSLLH